MFYNILCIERFLKNKWLMYLKYPYILPLKHVDDFNIVCNGHIVESTQSVRYLGLTIDNSLSGEKSVNNIVSKVNSRPNCYIDKPGY